MSSISDLKEFLEWSQSEIGIRNIMDVTGKDRNEAEKFVRTELMGNPNLGRFIERGQDKLKNLSQLLHNPGMFKENVGTSRFPDGTNYIGQLAENEDHILIPHGKGLHRSLPSSKYPHGDTLYEGFYKYGNRDGYGYIGNNPDDAPVFYREAGNNFQPVTGQPSSGESYDKQYQLQHLIKSRKKRHPPIKGGKRKSRRPRKSKKNIKKKRKTRKN